MGTAAPRHFPLLWADHARCQGRWNRSIARTAPAAIALHAAGCPRPSRACAHPRTEPEKITANPLISRNSVPEMQQKAANTRGARRNSLRTGNFPRFNREFRSSEKHAHRRVCRDCNHRRDMSPAAAAGARSLTYSSWFVPVKVHRSCDGASVLKFRFCPRLWKNASYEVDDGDAFLGADGGGVGRPTGACGLSEAIRF